MQGQRRTGNAVKQFELTFAVYELALHVQVASILQTFGDGATNMAMSVQCTDLAFRYLSDQY